MRLEFLGNRLLELLQLRRGVGLAQHPALPPGRQALLLVLLLRGEIAAHHDHPTAALHLVDDLTADRVNLAARHVANVGEDIPHVLQLLARRRQEGKDQLVLLVARHSGIVGPGAGKLAGQVVETILVRLLSDKPVSHGGVIARDVLGQHTPLRVEDATPRGLRQRAPAQRFAGDRLPVGGLRNLHLHRPGKQADRKQDQENQNDLDATLEHRSSLNVNRTVDAPLTPSVYRHARMVPSRCASSG